jgi:hypothetical protein
MTNPEQQVTIIYAADIIRVHGASCPDVKKDSRNAVTVYTITASTQSEVANDFYADFLDSGEMTDNEALAYSQFLPCCNLDIA